MSERSAESTARRIGWSLVGVQVILFAALVVDPTGGDWSVPRPVSLLGWAMMLIGFLFAAASVPDLGSALTATPEPKHGESLRCDGAYARVRHPIYSAVLLVVAGRVLQGGSWWLVAVGLLTFGFFSAKAMWEERRLIARYPDYPDYSRHVPRFVPRLWPRPADGPDAL
jgi:protein-S-isoprenylcysteine O-methyltransferase Ste14